MRTSNLTVFVLLSALLATAWSSPVSGECDQLQSTLKNEITNVIRGVFRFAFGSQCSRTDLALKVYLLQVLGDVTNVLNNSCSEVPIRPFDDQCGEQHLIVELQDSVKKTAAISKKMCSAGCKENESELLLSVEWAVKFVNGLIH